MSTPPGNKEKKESRHPGLVGTGSYRRDKTRKGRLGRLTRRIIEKQKKEAYDFAKVYDNLQPAGWFRKQKGSRS